MRTILALSLLAAAFATVPVAAAECVPGVACADTGSGGWGNCSYGYGYNYGSVRATTPAGSVATGGSTWCSGYPGWYEYNAIGVYAYTTGGPAGTVYASAGWWGYESVWGNYCNTYTYTYVNGNWDYDQYGCPVGIPPAVPAVLP